MTQASRTVAVILLCLACLPAVAVFAGEKERLLFRPGPVESYPARDSHDGITVAADPFTTREKTKEVFGKFDLLKAGYMPVLVVMANPTDKTVRMDDLLVKLVTRDRQNIEPTPGESVTMYVRGKTRKSDPRKIPSPLPWPRSGKTDSGIEVQVHEFSMRMLPAVGVATGFFYFDLGHRPDLLKGAKLFISNMTWAHNGQALLYFEVPLDAALAGAPPK